MLAMTDASRGRCCATSCWAEEPDLGTVDGPRPQLGRCGICGMPVMTVVEPGDGSVSRVSLTRAEARLFRACRATPTGSRRALGAWVGWRDLTIISMAIAQAGATAPAYS